MAPGTVYPAGVQVTVPMEKCVCGFAAQTAAATEESSVWKSRRAWLKNNLPSVISLLSVILNVVILSALIPSMKSDIAYVQGQSDSVQHQVDSWFEKINSANGAITEFNGNLASINGSVSQAQATADDAQQRAASSLAFIVLQTNSFYANLNDSIHNAAMVGAQLTSQASSAMSLLSTFNSSLQSQMQSMQNTFRAVTNFLPDLSTSAGAADITWNGREVNICASARSCRTRSA